MRRLIRWLVAPAIVALVGAGAIAWLMLRPVTVTVAHIESDVPIEVFGLGTVEARVLSRIGFEVGAALTELHADHGDHTKTGDILARLHSAEQEARLAKSEAGVISAEAQLHRAEAGVERAQTVLAQRQETNRRRQVLLANRTVAVEAAEQAQMEADVAAAELTIAMRDAEVARAALANAEAQLLYDRVLLDHHTLRAPFDAIVVERHRELGAVLNPGEIVYTLVDPATVWVLAYVDESRAGEIAVGQPAQVRLRSLPGEVFEGAVVRIGIESDRVNEERRIYVACGRCPPSFHLGEQAEIVVRVTTVPEGIFVPETALLLVREREARAWTVADGVLSTRLISIGRRTLDGRIEITDRLPDGVSIVIGRPSGLREGRAAHVAGSAAQ